MKRSKADHRVVRDKRGRKWSVTVTTIDDDDDIAHWLDFSPEQRLDLMTECVLDGLRVKGDGDVPRLRRVHRVFNAHSVRYLIIGGYAVPEYALTHQGSPTERAGPTPVGHGFEVAVAMAVAHADPS